MSILVVRNPGSGSADAATHLTEAVAARDDLILVDTESPEDVYRAVEEAAKKGYDTIAAAGGDGTVHLVANALMSVGDSAETRPALAILPLGTGNDFARTLAVPLDPNIALALISYGDRRVIDLISVCPDEGCGDVCFAINLASGGFTGEIRKALDGDLKKKWGPLSYLIAGLETLPDAAIYDVGLRRDDGPEERYALHNLAVASGRTAGGGQPAAPQANPEDGSLDVVAVRETTTAGRAALAARAAMGHYLESELVETWRARRIAVTSSPPMQFAVDGEMKAETPVTFEVVPHALRVVVGEGYSPEAEAAG